MRKFIYFFMLVILSMAYVSGVDPAAQLNIDLSVDGGLTYTSVKSNQWTCPNGEVYRTYGSTTDTWGLSAGELLGQNFSNSSFVARGKYVTTGRLNQDFSSLGGWDHIEVQVYYDAEPNLTYEDPTPAHLSTIGSTVRLNVSSDLVLDLCETTNDYNGSFEVYVMTLSDGDTKCYWEMEGLEDDISRTFNVKGTNGPFETTTDNRNTAVVNLNSTLNLTYPLNNTQFNVTSLVLNWTLTNTQNDHTYSKIYLKNESSDQNEFLIFTGFREYNITSYFEFNFSTGFITSTHPGLIALYHLNEDDSFGETTEIAFDFVSEFNRTIGGATLDIINAKFGGAYDFSIDTDNIKIGDGTEFNDTCDNGCSFGAWVNSRDNSSNGFIISKGDSSPADHYFDLFQSFSGKATFRIANGTTTLPCTVTSNTGMTENTWYQIIGTYNGTYMRLYQDAVLVANKTCDIGLDWGSGDLDTLIGATQILSPPVGQAFDGLIDEVFIWNRSISASEVNESYYLQNSTYYWHSEIKEAVNWSYIVEDELEFTIGTLAEPVADSCTYTSGNWAVLCSDLCNIVSDVTIDTGANISISGSGSFTLDSATIKGWARTIVTGGCNYLQKNGGKLFR